MAIKKKILIAIPTSFSVNIFLKEQIEKLSHLNYDIVLICSGKVSEEIFRNVKHYNIKIPRGVSLINYLKNTFKIRKIVKLEKPDLIHVHFSAAIFLFAISKEKFWPPLIATVQGVVFTASTGLKKYLIGFAELLSFKRFNNVIVLTKDDYSTLKNYDINVNIQKSFGFGCNLKLYNSNNFETSQKLSLMEKYEFKYDDIVLVYIGRLTHFKGFHIVYKAFKILNSKIKNLKLVVCGNYDVLHSSGLSKNEENLLLKDSSIRFLGFINNVQDILAISHINIFPSEREGLPVNVMESMAMQVPVVAYKSRGAKDIISHMINGYLVEKRNPESFANAILYLLSNPSILNSFKSNLKIKRNEFDRKRYIEEYTLLYESYFK